MAGALKAGPKAPVTAPPLDLSHLPASGGDRVVAFIEEYLRVPKGLGARQPVRLRPWQRDIVHGLFDAPRPRQGLLSLPRGNGKTALAAMLAAYALYADEVESAQVLCVASDERQAGITFAQVRRMVELDPRLEERTHVYRDRLVVPHTNSELRPLPAEAAALQGYDPSLCVVDELHVVPEDVWEAMTMAAGKRDRSLTLAISTPAGDTDAVMWKLRQYALDNEDESFYFKEFAAPADCDVADEEAWHVANPALSDFLHIDALRTNRRTSRESAFRRYRLGQWVGRDDQWLPDRAWAACADRDRTVEDGATVVLSLDGSFNSDTTAVVGVTVEETPHVFVVGLWQRPAGSVDWQVPILEVEEAIRAACRRYLVREVACDPFRWARTMQVLEAEGLTIVEYGQTPARMTPATQQLYEAVVNRQVTHSGDADLAAHVAHATLRVDPRGQRLAKEHKHSTKRIDLAVAAVMGFDRARWHAAQGVPRIW